MRWIVASLDIDVISAVALQVATTETALEDTRAKLDEVKQSCAKLTEELASETNAKDVALQSLQVNLNEEIATHQPTVPPTVSDGRIGPQFSGCAFSKLLQPRTVGDCVHLHHG